MGNNTGHVRETEKKKEENNTNLKLQSMQR